MPHSQAIEKLEHLVDEIGALHSKLILLIGGPQSGKSTLLRNFASKRGLTPLLVGSELGGRLAIIPQKRRQLETTSIFRELAERHATGDLLLLDNIELLFDRTLQLDPLDLLKRHARPRAVVAVWPGQVHNGRLTYAPTGHPEHQGYGVDGLVTLVIQ